MIYQTGTITTTAGQTKIKGTGTRWKDNLAGISEGCPISYLINNVVYMNTVLSVNSDTEINLTYPVPVAASAAKYQIATFVLDSMSDGVRKMLANQQYIQYFLRNMDTWMTQDGIVEIKTPTGETIKLEGITGLKNLIDKKQPSGNYADGARFKTATSNVSISPMEGSISLILQNDGTLFMWDGTKSIFLVSPSGEIAIGSMSYSRLINVPIVQVTGNSSTRFMSQKAITDAISGLADGNRFRGSPTNSSISPPNGSISLVLQDDGTLFTWNGSTSIFSVSPQGVIAKGSVPYERLTGVTTDSNGFVKKASPIVKLFTDDIELNDESEGVEMEHLGVGRYLITGVIGFNADGAWGVNNGFVIPQDHNGKNMVLIDYEVRPDGDIEVFVFHQQNAEMPERFQNKRIKHFDEDGNPVYFENYEPCDVPESRWIDMRVEMPPNSIYNQKLAEAERLAKIEAERVAKEEAERIEKESAS